MPRKSKRLTKALKHAGRIVSKDRVSEGMGHYPTRPGWELPMEPPFWTAAKKGKHGR
jgi:hypothetical protein